MALFYECRNKLFGGRLILCLGATPFIMIFATPSFLAAPISPGLGIEHRGLYSMANPGEMHPFYQIFLVLVL